MGKVKAPKKSGSSSTNPQKCTCEHPYNCDCGHRPPRPSKGHRWDPITQAWGGKGHKQKGASGQTASVAAEAKTTDIGKTQIAQWQRLPSQLLNEVCKREGRPPAKYKSIGTSSLKQKYRVIVQDAKLSRRGTDHDLLFVPAKACDNAEQAKEEAALLALLHMTPKLPHERKLPEPYKTTWLYAVEASKTDKKKSTSASNTATANTAAAPNDKSKGTSKATTDLTMARSFASMAEKRRQQDEKRKARNARIQHHMAILEANHDHQVFLSAKCREQIETLLRGDTVNVQDLLISEEEAEQDEQDDDLTAEVRPYVLRRLRGEGFTKGQARTAYSQLSSSPTGNLEEERWDGVYDECLQWLCIHLDEDQLPEGFDPRGRTLDVVVAPAKLSMKSAGSAPSNGDHTEEARHLAGRYNLPVNEASILLERWVSNRSVEDTLFRQFCIAADFMAPIQTNERDSLNEEILNEELEALGAIFPPDICLIQQSGDLVTIRLSLSTESAATIDMEVIVRNGIYPSAFPERILLSGSLDDSCSLGTVFHVEIIKFMSSLSLGDPMVYELYGKAMSLVRNAQDGELSPFPLFPSTVDDGAGPSKWEPPSTESSERLEKGASRASSSKPLAVRRPRARGSFWSTPPLRTPKAKAFPKVSADMSKQRHSLPAARARAEFLSAMNEADQNGRVLLLTGETGCGKSTQIPQFLLEDAPGDVKIVVAQPRRLAATGVASRVADERGEKEPGQGSVGYIVRGDSAVCFNTRLLFCTTGVLLRQLQSDGALDSITHVIVDEVHERHLDTDVLLGILKRSLDETPHLRVILMSATLDADRFAAYWGPSTPRVHIPGRTFPVKDFTLEDVLSLTGYIPPKKGKKKRYFGGMNYRNKKLTPWVDSEKSDDEDETNEEMPQSPSRQGSNETDRSSGHACNIPMDELLKRGNQQSVDYDMLGRLVKYLVEKNVPGDMGSILVFMPGAPEIGAALETIRRMTRGIPLELLALHGGLQPREQNLVFRPSRKGLTKVILSTNVAETSITIPDCTVVIDSCREKQSSFDPSNRMPLLVEGFASKDRLKQRRGRAGRVQSGTCFKLISKETLSKLPEHGEPEIRRCALDQTLLSLMFLGAEDGSGVFLTTLLDPPSRHSIDAALFSLRKLGAVAGSSPTTSFLTPLGMHLAGIPAPPTVGKILVMGSILGCRSAALAMAAGMSVGRSPFIRIDNRRNRQPTEEESIEDMKRNNILQARDKLFKSVGNSDHAMLAAAYLKWDSVRTGASDRKRFCESMGLSFNGMRDMKQLVLQLDSSLAVSGYVASQEADRNARSWRIIRSCAVSAMSPSQLVRVQRPKTKYIETAEGAVEKGGVARELQFYIRREDTTLNNRQDTTPSAISRRYHDVPEERVFFHPSSANFSVGHYHCPWLVYHELVRTSKSFLRDATECSAYSLLLFGGSLEVQAGKGLIVVDDWVRLSANARIGALIGGLRRKVDDLLSQKVKDPSFDIAGTVEMKLIVGLLVSDGLGE